MKYTAGRLFLIPCVVLLGAHFAHAKDRAGVTPISGIPWQPSKGGPKVVYGTDDRLDVYEVTDPIRRSQAASTCAVVESFDLTNNGDGTYGLSFSQYREFGEPACSDEPFGDQPVAAFCSGFMVGDDIIATAGHCLDASDMSTTRFVFGFVMENASTPVDTYPSNQIYTPIEILGHELSGDFDYTVVRVDRAITAPGAHPLAIRRTGVVSVGENVGVIGHPAGLPMKIAFGASTAVRSLGNDGFFICNTDTFGGNSGSPIFNASTGLVEGILVRGETDYVDDGPCFRSNTVASDSGRGEDVSKASSFAEFVPELAESKGALTLSGSTVKCGGTLFVTVRDIDLVGVPSTTVTAASSAGDSEILTLAAVVGQTGAFQASVVVNSGAAVTGNGALETAQGGTVTFTYHDADNGSGAVADVHVAAELDCVAPEVSDVELAFVGSTQATVIFQTTEPATAVIRYGMSCGNLTQQAGGASDISHEISLNNLPATTTVNFVVDVTDAAGNTATFDNEGLCLRFTTLDPLNYFSNYYQGTANGLSNHRIQFQPSASPEGYIACIDEATSFTTNPAGGTVLSLDDDAVASIAISGGNAVQIYGDSFDEVLVCSNGFVTFDASDNSYDESLTQHFLYKRVSGFFHDLQPNVRGEVSYKQTGECLAITFSDVPEYSSVDPVPSNSNTFQIELYFDGRIALTYLNLSTSSAVVGLSKGLGFPSDFLPSDFRSYANCDIDDFDSDGLPNDWELRAGLDGNSGLGDDGADGDPDEDGLSNLEEFQEGTNPLRADSDFDDVDDGAEVTASTDPTGADAFHSQDTDHNHQFTMSEVLRVIQLYNSKAYHCDEAEEDGFGLGAGVQNCTRSNADYRAPAFVINMSEVLRIIQIYNLGGYIRDTLTEDSFAPDPFQVRAVHTTPPTYIAGQDIEVMVTITATGPENIMAMGLIDSIPPGWTYASAQACSDVLPGITPQPGASGQLEFAWITVPSLPYCFRYRLNIPENADGDVAIRGQVKYRTTAPERLGIPDFVSIAGPSNSL